MQSDRQNRILLGLKPNTRIKVVCHGSGASALSALLLAALIGTATTGFWVLVKVELVPALYSHRWTIWWACQGGIGSRLV